ncbi:hypothetical protein AgCh_022657 [Apium graveolens]
MRRRKEVPRQVLSVKVIRNKSTGQPEGYSFIEFVSRAVAERTLHRNSTARKRMLLKKSKKSLTGSSLMKLPRLRRFKTT